MILKLTFIFLFNVLHQCSAHPIKESEAITEGSTPASDVQGPTYTYESDDIVSAIAAEFLFLIAGDHILLPALPNPEEDLKLHKRAQILARLLTKLHCMRRIYTLLNNTAQEIALQSWSKSNDRHLFSQIFDRVLEELNNDPELYAVFLFEENATDDKSVVLSKTHKSLAPIKKRTFYEITPEQIAKTEELLQNKLVKKIVLSIELLKQSEEQMTNVPKSAEALRKHITTAKTVYKLASAESLETRLRIQRAFDETVNETLDKFEVVSSVSYEGTFYDALQKKIEKDPILKDELENIKESLE